MSNILKKLFQQVKNTTKSRLVFGVNTNAGGLRAT